jgi:type IV fimbrial biogenesis protein FimT
MSEIETDSSDAPMSASGFTLIELLITIAIASVLLAVAVPSFNGMIVSNRLTTQANDMVGAINFARSEAIKRNASLTFCRVGSVDAIACATGAGPWQHWIVRNAAGTVVRRGVVSTHGGKIVVRSTLTTDQAVFGSDGLVRTGAGLVNDHQISVCAVNGGDNNFREVVLGAGSRISTAVDTAEAC